jgi:hypothetical protein
MPSSRAFDTEIAPPAGGVCVPIWSTRDVHGSCTFQQGGALMPHENDFGGTAATAFGHLLRTVYPNTGFTPIRLFENFRRTLSHNSCPAG